MKVQLADGATLPLHQPPLVQVQKVMGAERHVMELEFAAGARDLGRLIALFDSPANTETLVLHDETTGKAFTHTGYVFFLEGAVRRVPQSAPAPDKAPVYTDHLFVKLGQKTYMEQRLEQALRALGEQDTPPKAATP